MKNVVDTQIQFMKTSNAIAVLVASDLKFNPETLRIEDLEEDEELYDTLQTATLAAGLQRLFSNKNR